MVLDSAAVRDPMRFELMF